jgi:hypothetical protein
MEKWVSIIHLVTATLTAISIALAGWLMSELGGLRHDIHQLDTRIVTVEQTQFTQKESHALNQQIFAEIGDLKNDVAKAYNHPPQWLIEIIKGQTDRLDRVERALAATHPKAP